MLSAAFISTKAAIKINSVGKKHSNTSMLDLGGTI
jgi:hypothetical protein